MAYYYYKEYSKLELHYWLKHNSHIIDAIVQNKCENEFLRLLVEIAATFKIEISIQTEPLAEGGLTRYYNIISRQEGNKAVITTAVVTAIATAILVTPITTSLTKLTEIAIEKIFEDQEVKQQQDEKTSLEIKKLKQEIKLDSLRLDQNFTIENRRSNFYHYLSISENVEKVSLVLYDERHNILIPEGIVEKNDFEAMQNHEHTASLYSQKLSDSYLIEDSNEEIKNANVEIISPDFSVNSNKWKGLYNGKQISFKIESQEFNNLVQAGNIQFKKGSTINCFMTIKRKGTRTKIYQVEVINYYLDGNQKIEIDQIE